jgi:uncharacterized membrane protein
MSATRPGPGSIVPGAAAVFAVAGYAILAHAVMSRAQPTRAAALVALLPLVGSILVLAWSTRWRLLAVGAASALAACPLLLWPERGLDLSAIYLGQYVAVQAALAALFGRTLARGREPLVTRLARSVHGELPPPIDRYTRAVTLAWTLFFVAMAASAILLYVLAPRSTWSSFVNLLTVPCVAAMFAIEYAVRRVRFPWFRHASVMAGVRAFLQAFGRRDR